MKIIWATRGRSWGFRFLRDGDFVDPLPEYDRAFSGLDSALEVWRRDEDRVAIRFPDPLGRKDIVGRLIPHEFVVFGPLNDRINSVADGLQEVWPLVAAEFAQVWNLDEPPTAKK